MDSEKQSPYYNIFLKLIEELKVNVRNDMAKPEQPQLTTPAGIKFWINTDTGTVWGILFNDDKHVLSWNAAERLHEVRGVDSTCLADSIKEQLPLTPCKYGELDLGDFSLGIPKGGSFESGLNNIGMYDLCLPGSMRVYLRSGNPVIGVTVDNCDCWKVG